ncbi:MAG: hypothetical protein FJ116_11265 [Deltaproteobacteria bacterium]|nr:hypothetical protein [Deltaproteobacteria bacterium]
MIYHPREQSVRWMYLCEFLFFATICAAFVALVPMKARAEQSQLRQSKSREPKMTLLNLIGEQPIAVKGVGQSEFSYVFQWSEQITSEAD